MKLKSVFLLFFFFIILTFTGCANIKDPISLSGTYFNTFVSITIYDSTDTKLLDQCADYLEYYDKLFSLTREDSELYRLNTAYLPDIPTEVSPELGFLLQKGMEYTKNSNGAFSILLSPLTSLWDFTASTPMLPKDQDITLALTKISPEDIRLDSRSATFKKPGMGIDLGSISKGYIADQLKNFLVSQGVKSGLINLGGNILCIGSKPDGRNFTIGIKQPFSEAAEILGTVSICDKSIVSSGIYERCFTLDNKLYHHLLDTTTGYPLENELISVTIISPLSLDGDALSTTCFALGLKDGMEYLEKLEDVDAIFVDKDGALHYTDNFIKKYSFSTKK